MRSTMRRFWLDHSREASVEEMMLDSSAPEMSKEEVPELLSYLPDIRGKTVLELGAGIGRYTSELARTAKKVIAVDFMESFLDKNRKENQHKGNIEFVVSDVTKLEQPKESVDLIFSNWLLMYLEDSEVQELFTKQLSWLTPEGYLFIRESCRRPAGNDHIGPNPTHYRGPEEYGAFYSLTQLPCDSNNVYGYDLVLSRSVDTYIKFKNNKNQIIWFIQKVKKEKSTNQGYKSFHEFLGRQQCTTQSILMNERICGYGFVSPGGLETTKECVRMLHLKANQRVLDVGSGPGGAAFYMSKNFGVNVVGIDLSSNMVQIAMQRAQEASVSPTQVVFETADATKREYPDESFDVVYSRDTILHIKDKLALFRRFYNCLQPGGKVLISDLCCSPGEHTDQFEASVKQGEYSLLSLDAYAKLLERAGFVNVRAEDRSQQFAEIHRSEISHTEADRDKFVADFGETVYNYFVGGWKKKLGCAEVGDQIWGLFFAEKPCN